MMNRGKAFTLCAIACVAMGSLAIVGCNGGGGNENGGGDGGRRSFLSLGTAPVGGAFQPVGNALAEVLNEFKGENNWKVQAKGTKGSQENIRRLDQGDLQLALSNAAITYFAVRGEAGWEQPYDMRAVVTIAPNVGMFLTETDSGIKQLSDLKGKRVVCGPSGAGFDMFLAPMLEAHGVTLDEIQKLNNTQSGSVELLQDDNADAAFLGGAVPTGAIQSACSELDVYFIPFDPEVRQELIREYPFFHPFTIKKDVYSDLTSDFEGLNVGSMHLIASASADEELIYQVTKTIWENREHINHPAKKFISEDNAARYTGTEFHPGAERFYREIGIWPDGDDAPAGETEAPETGGATSNQTEGTEAAAEPPANNSPE